MTSPRKTPIPQRTVAERIATVLAGLDRLAAHMQRCDVCTRPKSRTPRLKGCSVAHLMSHTVAMDYAAARESLPASKPVQGEIPF